MVKAEITARCDYNGKDGLYVIVRIVEPRLAVVLISADGTELNTALINQGLASPIRPGAGGFRY